MPPINLLAVFAAAASALALGAVWYAPFAFGRLWQRAVPLSDAQLRSGSPWRMLGAALLLSLLAALVFAAFLGPAPPLPLALGAGLAAGVGWVAASLGIQYLFERRPRVLLLINGGYHAAQFTLYGLILGLWH